MDYYKSNKQINEVAKCASKKQETNPMNNRVQSKRRKIYVGMDISLLSIEIYVLLNANEGKSFGKIGNTEEEINNFFDGFTDPNDTIVAVLETGTHSTSIARLLKKQRL